MHLLVDLKIESYTSTIIQQAYNLAEQCGERVEN